MFPGYPMLYVFFSRVACFQYNCPILSACFSGLSMLFENYSKGPMFSVCLPAVPRPLSQARCPKLALGTSCNLIGHCDVLKGYFLGLGLVHCTIGHTILGLHEVLTPPKNWNINRWPARFSALCSPVSLRCYGEKVSHSLGSPWLALWKWLCWEIVALASPQFFRDILEKDLIQFMSKHEVRALANSLFLVCSWNYVAEFSRLV